MVLSVLRGRKAVLVKGPRLSGCSRRRRAPGGPSPGTGPAGARGSSRRTLLGRRRDSGAWTAWQ